MPTPKGNTSIYLLPGMIAEVKIDNFYVGHGQRKISDGAGAYSMKSLINGFALMDDEVGSLEAIPGEPAVEYTHKKFALNKIYFFARTGESCTVDIISVPIHDHSSIVAGGPAYGTYFSDDETVDGGEG